MGHLSPRKSLSSTHAALDAAVALRGSAWCRPSERKRIMKVSELRELLKDLPDDMPVGVEFPDSHHANQCHDTLDVRATRVTDPFHKFAGVTKEIFVLEVF